MRCSFPRFCARVFLAVSAFTSVCVANVYAGDPSSGSPEMKATVHSGAAAGSKPASEFPPPGASPFDSIGESKSDAEASKTKTAKGEKPAGAKPSLGTREPRIESGVKKVEEALASPTKVEFIDTPLKEVMDYFRDLHKIEIVIDPNALKAAGVEPDAAVTMNLDNISLENALDLLLENLKLTWTVADNVLLITSSDKEASLLETHVYDVADLVVHVDGHGEKVDGYYPLVRTLKSIDASSWEENGGNGKVRGHSLGTAKVIVVTNTYRVHRKIAALLKDIRSIETATPNAHVPERTADSVKGTTQSEQGSGGALGGASGTAGGKGAVDVGGKLGGSEGGGGEGGGGKGGGGKGGDSKGGDSKGGDGKGGGGETDSGAAGSNDRTDPFADGASAGK